MRTKAITSDCASCTIMKVNDESHMICNWGKSPKRLFPQKGKKPLFCKLNKDQSIEENGDVEILRK